MRRARRSMLRAKQMLPLRQQSYRVERAYEHIMPHVGFSESGQWRPQRDDPESLRALRTRPKAMPAAIPLASPSSTAGCNAASLAWYCCSSPSEDRNGAHNLTGVFVTPGPDLFGHEAVKLIGQLRLRVGMAAALSMNVDVESIAT